MKKLCVLLTILLITCGCSTQTSPGGKSELLAAVSSAENPLTPAGWVQDSLVTEFQFAHIAMPCEGGPGQSLCAAIEPAEWTEADKRAVLKVLEQLVSRPKIRPLVEIIVSGGYRYFVKSRWGFTSSDGNFTRAQRVQAWTGLPEMIGVNQRFIDDPLGADEYAGFDLKQFIVLHEVFHLLDRIRTHTATQDYQDAFVASLSGVSQDACQAIRDDFVNLANVGRDLEGWNRMRRQVRSIPIGALGRSMPSAITCLKAGDGLVEGFADYGAFWYLDPAAPENFPKPMMDWFRKTYPDR